MSVKSAISIILETPLKTGVISVEASGIDDRLGSEWEDTTGDEGVG